MTDAKPFPCLPVVARSDPYEAWLAAVATDLTALREKIRTPPAADCSPEEPARYLLSLDALGPLPPTNLPFLYANAPTPDILSTGAGIVGSLYSRAHDPLLLGRLTHHAGYGHTPAPTLVNTFFAVGLEGSAEGSPRVAYHAANLNMHDLGCRSEGDLRALYDRILGAATW